MNSLPKSGLAGLLLLAGVAGAGAADPASRLLPPAPALPALYNWGGFYAGVQAGYAWEDERARPYFAANRIFTGNAFSSHRDTAIGGVHAGFNLQFDAVVVGAEADLEAVNASGGFRDPAGIVRVKRDWQASVRGRIGYAFDRFMIFGTAGAAFTEFNGFIGNSATGFGETTSVSKTGFTGGGGVNYAFADNWVGGLEYRYTTFAKFDSVARNAFVGLGSEHEQTLHALRASVAYKF